MSDLLENEFNFDWTIAPITLESFFRDSFEKEHLVVKRGQPDYYAGLLSLDDIDHAVTSMSMLDRDLQVVNADARIARSDYAYPNGFVDPSRVYQLFADGGTIILPSLQERLPRLAAFCRALECAFSSRVQTNIYLTQSQSQGFKPHYDNHDVFVLQIEGTKEWRIYDTPLALPLRDQGFSPDEVEIGAETARFLLEPGDMVYIPRGMAHDAVATGEVSLHITTGLLVRTWADLMLDAVAALSREEPAFRHSLPPGFAQGGFERADARERFGELLAMVAARADADGAFDRFEDEFVSTRAPLVHGQMGQIGRLSQLGPDSEVGARPNLIYRLSTEAAESAEDGADGGTEDGADGAANGGAVRIKCHGSDIRLPIHVHDAVAHALTTHRFRVRDLPGELDDDGKVVLIRRMIREGLVMIHA